MDENRIIEITPDLERRVLAERRRGPREQLAALQTRLSYIAHLSGPPYLGPGSYKPDYVLDCLKEIYKIATGEKEV